MAKLNIINSLQSSQSSRSIRGQFLVKGKGQKERQIEIDR